METPDNLPLRRESRDAFLSIERLGVFGFLGDQAVDLESIERKQSIESLATELARYGYEDGSDDEALSIRTGMGLMKEFAFHAEYGQDPHILNYHIGEGEIWRKTINVFHAFLGEIQEFKNLAPTEQKRRIDEAILQLNGDPLIEAIYRKGMGVLVGGGAKYLISDLISRRNIFHVNTGNEYAYGSFYRFVSAPLPSLAEFNAIEKQTPLGNFAVTVPIGLYAELRRASIVYPDSKPIELSRSQRLLVPLNYGGQQIFCEQ